MPELKFPNHVLNQTWTVKLRPDFNANQAKVELAAFARESGCIPHAYLIEEGKVTVLCRNPKFLTFVKVADGR